MKASINALTAFPLVSGELNVTVTIPLIKAGEIAKASYEIASGKPYELEIKPKRKQRSLDANAYCWVLADKIAAAVGVSKEAVYKKVVSECGIFEITPVAAEAVERWREIWNARGLGWQSEILGESLTPGYINVINYFGTSVYKADEMARVINSLVEEAKQLGIETLSPDKLDGLIKGCSNG